MWGEEEIGRIASFLGIPISARLAREKHTHPHLPPPLEVCVIVEKNFNYPPNVRIRLEGNKGAPSRDTIVSLEYEQKIPYCFRCSGFGHWPQHCRKHENVRPGIWNRIISESPKLPEVQLETSSTEEYIPAKGKFENSKSRRRRTRRSHRKRRFRTEYRRVLTDHTEEKYGESCVNQEISTPNSIRVESPKPVEPRLQIEWYQNENILEPTTEPADPVMPKPADPITPNSARSAASQIEPECA